MDTSINMRLLILALVVLCAHATPQYTKTAGGVKGGYSGRGYQYQGGENLVNNYYNNSTQHQGYGGYGGNGGYGVRPNHSEPVNYEKGVCYIEVPTASLVRDPAHVPAGNGSRPDLSRIRSCCSGYVRNIHNFRICDPVCDRECINGLCSAPNVCSCFPDHVKNLAGICVATCPIGCQNGQCSGGECICKDGYRLDSESKFCVPYCREQCGGPGLGNCTAPNVCECKNGLKPTPEGSCKSASSGSQPCDRCKDGQCVGGECRCNYGYSKNQYGECIPHCSIPCTPPTRCVAHNVCDNPANPSNPSATTVATTYGPHPSHNGQNPPGVPYGQQPQYPNYPGNSPSNYPGQAGQNYPSQPNQNYPGQPNQNYPGQPNQNYPGQPNQNYPGQSNQNYPGQTQPNFPGYQQINYPANQQSYYPGNPPNSYPGGPQSNQPGGPQSTHPGSPQNTNPSYPHNNSPGGQNPYPGYPGYQPTNNTGNPQNNRPGSQPSNYPGSPYNSTHPYPPNPNQRPQYNPNGQPIYTYVPGSLPGSPLYPDSQHLGPDQRPNQGNPSPNSSQPLPNGAYYPSSQYYPGSQYYPDQHPNPSSGYQPVQRPTNAEPLYPNSQYYPGPQTDRNPSQPNQGQYPSYTPGSEYQHIYPGSQMSAVEMLCSVPCVNGTCVGRDMCACKAGYVPIAGDTTRCEPHCTGCSNGVCVSPYVCQCHPGYMKDFTVKGRSPCVRRIRRSVDSSAAVNVADLLVFEIPDDDDVN
ncbi:hypothetical protein PYW07_001452 [Mythimna separata]|uniref:EGF-like domain-containing protein n=1 Tax=Mythimna separata TaxID=271217 RepID=A0AAD7YTM1_MYTSE|nr:hypothetical protein PYW07_001452 [Mythimna separata]